MLCPCSWRAWKNYSRWQSTALISRFDLWADQWYHAHKIPLFWTISGRVLELGPGTGVNFSYYPPGTEVLAVEPNRHMHPHLERRAAEHQIHLRILEGPAERLPLLDSSIQNVVGTLVLCSVDSPFQVIQEIVRVLKPGGCYHFVEHVAGSGGMRWFQRSLQWPWRFLFDGCHLNRNPLRWLRTYDNLITQAVPLELGPDWLPVRPHLIGRAIKHPEPGFEFQSLTGTWGPDRS